jgi:bifunctional non-homologous end joining protein LigD
VAAKASERVGGVTVELSHLDKAFFPDDGISKGDLVGYYRDMATRMVPYLRDRPLVMMRYPDGITGQRIVQKNVSAHFPDWVTRAEVKKQDGAVCQVVGDKPATLVYLANQGCVELHVFLSALRALDQPDELVFDLDPPDDDHFRQACRHALDLRELLEGELGLTTYVKTTGGKGLHVHVPLRPSAGGHGEASPRETAAGFDAVRGFARDAARLLASRSPGQLTIEQRKQNRGPRIYLDIMRNAYAQLVVAPYSVRARPGAPVATPLHWEELSRDGLSPRQFTLTTISGRLDRGFADPWQGMTRHRRGLAGARRRLDALLAGIAR